MTRGDTVRPFGRQSEILTADTVEGRPVLLHVVTFDTPNALTVDSSWVDPATLSPIRMQSSNKFRVLDLEFGAGYRPRHHHAGGRRADDQRAPAGGPAVRVEHAAARSLVAAAPPGYTAQLPVFSDRAGQVVWYSVRVAADTFLPAPAATGRRCGSSSPGRIPAAPMPNGGCRSGTTSWIRRW